MMYFAYGSNMSRALMLRHCAGAREIGIAALGGYRFIITVDGYASIVPHPGGMVHGVLWRLGPRDLAALNAYESLDSGLYVRRTMPVVADGRRVAAMVYVARAHREGRPRPGYLEVVVEAARDWKLPAPYAQSIERWAPSRWSGRRARESRELA
jgi:cation transport regulator ChaC